MRKSTTTAVLTPPQEIIHPSGISWQTYETLLEELSDRRLRLTYHRGSGSAVSWRAVYGDEKLFVE